jgi:hypothetical protein
MEQRSTGGGIESRWHPGQPGANARMPGPLDRRRQSQRQITCQPSKRQSLATRAGQRAVGGSRVSSQSNQRRCWRQPGWTQICGNCERIHAEAMKPRQPTKARRPVLSVCLARLAGVLPSRACFAVGRRQRLPVRGSALPGQFARRCSPPTAAADRHSDISMLIKWPLICIGSIRSYELQSFTQMWATKWRPKCRRISRCNKAQVWPKPPPHAVNVLLALLRLRSTLTAAAFRRRLLLGSGFGKSKAGALSFHKTHLPLISGDKAIASEIAMEHAAAAAIASIQLLKQNRWLVRLSGHVPPHLAIICTSFPLPLHF